MKASGEGTRPNSATLQNAWQRLEAINFFCSAFNLSVWGRKQQLLKSRKKLKRTKSGGSSRQAGTRFDVEKTINLYFSIACRLCTVPMKEKAHHSTHYEVRCNFCTLQRVVLGSDWECELRRPQRDKHKTSRLSKSDSRYSVLSTGGTHL